MASEIRIYGTQTTPSKLLANDGDGLHPALERKYTMARTNFRKEKDTEKFAAITPYFIKNRNMIRNNEWDFIDIISSLPSRVIAVYENLNKRTSKSDLLRSDK